ncbi:MAG: ABC transporter ATP-binding protein [Myxococcota bacterium]
MNRLWNYTRRYRGRMIWGCMMLLLTNAATMVIPQLFRFAIDGISAGESAEQLRSIALTLAIIAGGGAVFRILSRINIFYVGRDVELDLRLDFYRHLTKLSPAFYQTHPTGDLMSRATNDLTQVRLLLGPGMLNFVNTAIAYSTAIPFMLFISPKLTLLAMTVYPPAMLTMRYFGRALYQRHRAVQVSMGSMSSLVQENLAGAHVVRAFANESQQASRFAERNDDYYRTNVRLAWIRSGLFRLMMTVANVAVLSVVFFGAGHVLEARLTLGELVALIEYIALLAWPTLALGWMLSLWQRGASAMRRLNEVLDVEPEIAPGPLQPAVVLPTVTVRDLTVTFEKRDVLSHIDLEIRPGSTLGIVGPIGSGKTMLVRAMLRLLNVPPKTVFVGGHDVTELDFKTLRGAFGYVPQAHTLFSKSLADNVSFGRPDASEEEIRAALMTAAFDSDLTTLPKGTDTLVGERGVTLSGGQKQRASIARALLLDPPILVLDDALSSVDAETEADILEALRATRNDRTTVIVAHRYSAVQGADEIIVLDQGRIVERGNHANLVVADGMYARMVRRQELEAGLAGARAAVGGGAA